MYFVLQIQSAFDLQIRVFMDILDIIYIINIKGMQKLIINERHDPNLQNNDQMGENPRLVYVSKIVCCLHYVCMNVQSTNWGCKRCK